MRSVEFTVEGLKILDQSLLPHKEEWIECKTAEDVAKAIREMKVRGAPAIGVAAAYGVAMADEPEKAAEILRKTRPTAVDLANGIDFVLDMLRNGIVGFQAAAQWEGQNDDKCKSIANHGASLISDKTTVLTHCNAGGIATSSAGTALGAIEEAKAQGKEIFVYVDETRPRFQGALSAWELGKAGIKHKVICDNAAGCLMKRGTVEMVMVGADRIAKNGDTANKIGTYSLSVLAKEHEIPFYVLAPISTFDDSIETGDEIKIEARDEKEVLEIAGKNMYPQGTKALNPAFDVTPAKNITAWVNENGVFRSIDELWKNTRE
jgi:S-methyl-5-thioribose-1-phosphate isomerase